MNLRRMRKPILIIWKLLTSPWSVWNNPALLPESERWIWTKFFPIMLISQLLFFPLVLSNSSDLAILKLGSSARLLFSLVLLVLSAAFQYFYILMQRWIIGFILKKYGTPLPRLELLTLIVYSAVPSCVLSLLGYYFIDPRWIGTVLVLILWFLVFYTGLSSNAALSQLSQGRRIFLATICFLAPYLILLVLGFLVGVIAIWFLSSPKMLRRELSPPKAIHQTP